MEDDTNLQVRHIANSLQYAKDMKSPRVIKTHMPFEFLPDKLLDTCKGVKDKMNGHISWYDFVLMFVSFVYVCRNPKDCCVSYYHHEKMGEGSFGLSGSMEQFSDLFLKGELGYGSIITHLKV